MSKSANETTFKDGFAIISGKDEKPRERKLTETTQVTESTNVATGVTDIAAAAAPVTDEARDDFESIEFPKERPEIIRRLVAKVRRKRFSPRLKNGKPAVIFRDSIRSSISCNPSDITDQRSYIEEEDNSDDSGSGFVPWRKRGIKDSQTQKKEKSSKEETIPENPTTESSVISQPSTTSKKKSTTASIPPEPRENVKAKAEASMKETKIPPASSRQVEVESSKKESKTTPTSGRSTKNGKFDGEGSKKERKVPIAPSRPAKSGKVVASKTNSQPHNKGGEAEKGPTVEGNTKTVPLTSTKPAVSASPVTTAPESTLPSSTLGYDMFPPDPPGVHTCDVLSSDLIEDANVYSSVNESFQSIAQIFDGVDMESYFNNVFGGDTKSSVSDEDAKKSVTSNCNTFWGSS